MRWFLTIISLFALAISVSVPAWAFDEKHLKKLKALNACVGCDLSGADLSGAKMKGANLSNADLSGADLSKANLSGAKMKGANLNGVDLSITTLWNAKLDGVIFCKTKTVKPPFYVPPCNTVSGTGGFMLSA
jgi:hypothetical protein